MISTTTQKNKKTLNLFKKTLVLLFWIFAWEVASQLISNNNELLLIILPGPFTVLKKWVELASTQPFISAAALTLLRVFSGLIFGIIIGFLFGLLTHYSSVIYALFSPILRMIRAIPVVAIIILMYLFFKSDILPIFIVFLMVLPIIWQTVHDSLNNADKRLFEMASVFRLSAKKTFFAVKLPSILSPFITSCVNALGLAWKSGVAAEVICLPNISLGTILWQGKGNVNFDEVYAVTLTVILLSVIIEILLKFLCNKYFTRGEVLSNG